MMHPLRILLADDHTLVRAGFRNLLETLADVEVVAEAEDGRVAVELILEHQPNIVFMDIAMPGLNGLDATAYAVRKYPKVRVIILSMHVNEEYVIQALQAGAAGYLLKDSDPEELVAALYAVSRGETYLGSPISKTNIENYLNRTASQDERQGVTNSSLTLRQREVLQLIAEGHTSKVIARQLGVSLKTVEAHRHNLMERLDVHDLASLVRIAIKMGITTTD